jgi:hypothetical protein
MALLDELAALFTLTDLLALVDSGAPEARGVAGALLGRRPDALDEVGIDRLVALASADVAAVRWAAHAIVRGAAARFASDPTVLFLLAESAWDDTRSAAFAVLRSEALRPHLGLDAIIRLCDSTIADVQAFGRELVVHRFVELDAEEVLFRLVEHPQRDMRLFALGLVRAELRDGYVPLARIEGFCRACLFDVWPDRRLKHGLLDFLLVRALRDERQGELVASSLDPVVRTRTREDFDRVAHALARIQLAWPAVRCELPLAEGAR